MITETFKITEQHIALIREMSVDTGVYERHGWGRNWIRANDE